jgi:thiosulfate dehydrogenase
MDAVKKRRAGARAVLVVLAAVASASAQEPASPAPAPADLPAGRTGAVVRYGYELLANTADWIGPKGRSGAYARSRMSCGNCHIDVGRRPFGNSFLDTHGLYPQYRAREGKVQTLAARVNACLEHPLRGKPLPEEGREMQAILLYIKWVGRGRPALENDPDDRLMPLALLSRAADPAAGKMVFEKRCVVCHGPDGRGRLKAGGASYLYPPLWGPESYMRGSSMSRLSLLARFIKGNMPLGTTAQTAVLTDEEAWDVAAFVNAQDRPGWAGPAPFPDAAEKPFDYPIGPYADGFPARQHERGPFAPIVEYWKVRQDARSNSMGI